MPARRVLDESHRYHHMLALNRRSPRGTVKAPLALASAGKGFTLIELLVVVALVAIMLGLAAPGFSDLRTNQKLASASNDLYASILQARNEALSLNRRVTVAPVTGTDWKTGWRIYVDLNNNLSYDASTDRMLSESGVVNAAFTLTGELGGATPAQFSFDPRGFLRVIDANRVVFSSGQTGRQKHVIVYATGRSRICDPKLTAGCDDD